MSAVLPLRPSWLPMTLVPDTPLTDTEFEELCFSNDWIQVERTRDGVIVMNPLTAMGTSEGNAEIATQLRVSWKTHRKGRVFDSNGGFFLPDGAMLCLDAANGVKLAWLIDPYSKTVSVYSPDKSPVTISSASVDGSGPVDGFRLDRNEVWTCYEV